METKYLLSDIIEMLKIIKDDKGKQQKVTTFLEKISKADHNSTFDVGDYNNIIPQHIVAMLMSIKYNEKKLLEVLNFLEDEILEKKVDKEEYVMKEYKNVIPEIVESLENGFIVYLNPETLEMEQIENSTIFEMEEFQEQNDDLLDEYQLDYIKWDNYIKFDPLGFEDITTITEDFTRQLEDISLATELEDALTLDESLDEFMKIINSSERNQQAWNTFKRKTLEDYVRNQLAGKLKGEEREAVLSESESL